MTPVFIEKTDAGATLTTWIYCAFWNLFSAEQQGRLGYINWYDAPNRWLTALYDKEKFKQIPNAYDWYFIQPHLSTPPPKILSDVWTWENWHDPAPVPLMAQPLQVIKDFYKKHLKFNSEVNERGQKLVDKYNIDFSKTIGITWRGTDNVTDGRITMPIEKYYRFIDEILLEVPDARIMCTAEEEKILDPLLERYPQAFCIDEFVSAPRFDESTPKHKRQNPEKISMGHMSGFERGMQPTLMVWMFSKCAYYIKNRSSTGAVASWLSDGKIISLAHPENLGYDKMDSEVEINGVRTPL